jgi:hypothetical protein
MTDEVAEWLVAELKRLQKAIDRNDDAIHAIEAIVYPMKAYMKVIATVSTIAATAAVATLVKILFP